MLPSLGGHRGHFQRESVKDCNQRFNFFNNRIVNVLYSLFDELFAMIYLLRKCSQRKHSARANCTCCNSTTTSLRQLLQSMSKALSKSLMPLLHGFRKFLVNFHFSNQNFLKSSIVRKMYF